MLRAASALVSAPLATRRARHKMGLTCTGGECPNSRIMHTARTTDCDGLIDEISPRSGNPAISSLAKVLEVCVQRRWNVLNAR